MKEFLLAYISIVISIHRFEELPEPKRGDVHERGDFLCV
jgi:hypothetical protein